MARRCRARATSSGQHEHHQPGEADASASAGRARTRSVDAPPAQPASAGHHVPTGVQRVGAPRSTREPAAARGPWRPGARTPATPPAPRGSARRRRPRPPPAPPPGRRPRRRTRRRGSPPCTACPSSASPRRIAASSRLGRVVQPAGRLVEQQHRRRGGEHDRQGQRQPLALGQVARVRVVGDAGRRAGRAASRRRARRAPAVAVGRGALVGDGLEVEQVGRRSAAPGRPAPRGARRPRPAGSAPSTATTPPARRPAALQGPEQRGLAGAVAAHQRDDLAGVQRRGRPRGRRPSRRTAPTQRRHGDRVAAAGSRAARSRGGRAGEPSAARRPAAGRRAPSAAAGPSRRAGPARRSGARRASRRASSAGVAAGTVPSPGTQDDPVGERHDPLEPVLGQQHRDARGRARAGCSVASTSSAAVGSSADVGSSSTSTRGCMVSTEPIATRCCSPPDRVRRAGAAARRCRAGRGSPRPGGASSPAGRPSCSMP